MLILPLGRLRFFTACLNRAKSKKPGLIREATTGVAPGMVKRGSLMAVKAIGPDISQYCHEGPNGRCYEEVRANTEKHPDRPPSP